MALLSGAMFAPSLATTLHVPQDYPTIQSAIDAAVTGDEVLLSPGVYTGEGNRGIEFRGKDIVVTSEAGAVQTIIDCEHVTRAFFIHESETPAARIEKVTIRNGDAHMSDPGLGFGGGIYCRISDATISDCVVQNCTAEVYGGGIALFSDGLVERCIIELNLGEEGGGIGVTWGGPTIEGCVVTGNLAGEGGGIYTVPSITIRGCTVSGNYAGTGGGIWIGNRASLAECIVWNNDAFGYGPEMVGSDNGAEINCCDIDSSGVDLPVDYDENCIFTNPLWCNPNAGDWTLRSDSPCLPERSPCGLLIGALGQGCEAPVPEGACCLSDGECLVEEEAECAQQQGIYMGDGSACVPNPCQPVPVESTTWGRIKAGYR